MDIEFDPAKDEANIRKHGLSLALAKDLEIDTAHVMKDTRQDYGEDRLIAVGPLNGRLCVLAFTVRKGKMRAISLRRANPRERRRFTP
ncbi:MAG: BrnT family toxin [Caulobacterales bacterium]|jgi:hypothetical protein